MASKLMPHTIVSLERAFGRLEGKLDGLVENVKGNHDMVVETNIRLTRLEEYMVTTIALRERITTEHLEYGTRISVLEKFKTQVLAYAAVIGTIAAVAVEMVTKVFKA